MSTALTDTSKLNLSFKKVLGKAQTSNTKEVSNEGIGSNISIGASTIFGYGPPTPTSSSYYTILGGVAEMVKLVATPMAGTKDSNGRYQAFALSLPTDYQASSSNPNKGTGFYVNGQVLNETTGTLQIIPPSFGANYTALVYHTSSSPTQIPALDARDWVLDYYNGIFFQQDPPSDADENPAYVNAFIYIGDYAAARLSGSGGAPGGSTTEVQFNNASSFGGSSNLTFNGATLTGSYTGSLAEITTLSASAMNLRPISGTLAGPGSYLGLDSNNNVILSPGDGATTSPAGATTQIQFNNAGSFGASANLTYNSSTNFMAFSGTMAVSGGVVHKRRAVATSYTASTADYLLGVTGVPTSILLDATAFDEGQVLVIKDESGAASSGNSITLAPSGAQTIDGVTSVAVESPYGSVLLYSNGTNWFIY
tara:strand:- start:1926 stop:3197 length:1272 start_codon:yes stop_codon:yes gene_type:complete